MPKIIITLIIIWFFTSFFFINQKNYEVHIEKLEKIVEHPEKLPTKELAKATTFGFSNLRADIYWLQAVQYIWWNAFHSEYKKYLYAMLDLITELNPYFEHPYEIWQLLLPSYNYRYDLITEDEQDIHTLEAEQLWLKWIENFCDPEKIELIKNEDNLLTLWNSESDDYKNACHSYSIPYYLAYTYFYYLQEPEKASDYYKIASTIDDVPEWAKSLAAIMQWKWWNRQKAYFMFLNIANYVDQDAKSCQAFANQLQWVWNWIFYYNELQIPQLPLTWELLEEIEKVRSELSKNVTKDESLKDTECINYVNKATRELNLAYIDIAEEKYFQKNWNHSKNAKELYEKWYLKNFVKDFQQYEWYEIVYIFDEELWKYSFEMWNY